MLSLDFDIIIFLILIAMIMIGYITGATTELIKLLKVIIPFLIVFYFGGYISRLIYNADLFKKLINQVESFKDMPYFHTFVMCISTFLAFFGSYYIISLIIKFIQKHIQNEFVTYKLGKFNHVTGAVLAVIRFYIIASILILPFYLLNITSKNDDFTTKLIIENPPVFTRIGHVVNSSEPVLNVSNALSNFTEVIDLNELKKDYKIVTDLKGAISDYELDVNYIYDRIINEGGSLDIGTNPTDNDILVAFLNNPDTFRNATTNPTILEDIIETKEELYPYKSLILWANSKDLTSLSEDELIVLFEEEFDSIINDTTDLEAQSKLHKAYKTAQIYNVINPWLKNKVGIQNIDLANLLLDENIEDILETLAIESNEKNSGLLYELKALNNESLTSKLPAVEKFVFNYDTKYRELLSSFKVDLPFKYKLIAATMQSVEFMDTLERSPLIAMYVVDTIDFLNNSKITLISNETLYQTIIKIAIPLYIINEDNQVLNDTRMDEILNKVDDFIDKVVVTEDFINDLVYAFITANYYNEDTDKDELYVLYLINSHQMTEDALTILKNHDLFKDNTELQTEFTDVLSKVGEEIG